MSVLKHMCPKCDYYMVLTPVTTETDEGEAQRNDLQRCCYNCGHMEKEKPGLVMETVIQEQASDSYRLFINEFTKEDPRLPHVKNLKCPNQECRSNQAGSGVQSDVIYIKYDTANMKFLYICTHCDTQWRSRNN
jgi:hypothetical protein